MFDDVFNGKRVLVTGHTGFKGSWLTAWLLKLGAEVIGLSRDIPTAPSMFEELGLDGRIDHRLVDVRDLDAVRGAILETRPDFVFHLAAQAIVSTSYADPVDTFTTNVVGTMNVLEALRQASWPCVAVMITSDKCYDNVEWVWGYREHDALGGKDIYSGSKGAAELVVKSYYHSYFSDGRLPVRIGVARAGNVIGGGDWAKDRIVADCMRAWSAGETVDIRSPSATRPWQHVLEPLSGYLTLAQQLVAKPGLDGEAFNFGPRAEQNHTVVELLGALAEAWDGRDPSEAYRITNDIPFHEAGLLKLNCDKALFHLRWESNLEYEETIRLIGEWYGAFYREKADMFAVTMAQLADYEQFAADRKRIWARA
ncbi:MAG: CDP-glucose 4,6-dehydratase [Sphingomonas sp.]|uniref:CDP-glucose 4,6-dehydratase n=1 Tax=Sphingomonas sp. TaxID=28214 RepID=UPI0025D76680|nr:CDP-glucose 4,6-dehydratase [Sphingomonas sp.]MBQ1497289.1 CDP-glucose 4,6-dehydratase [Sphingomonas sp.]